MSPLYHIVIQGTHDSLTMKLYGNSSIDIGQLSGNHDMETENLQIHAVSVKKEMAAEKWGKVEGILLDFYRFFLSARSRPSRCHIGRRTLSWAELWVKKSRDVAGRRLHRHEATERAMAEGMGRCRARFAGSGNSQRSMSCGV